ncbi:uncharacterized protein RCO7_07768 [Rhynchosporium graminicola]|uniref:DUF8004 domain-containing protein n=1 Tax=Rhynchosporium graminicola TaxID=2792576 RepID=A0A1E1K5K6_9HELO|nr:uncharacterized protein RCO7_07768 [Rhynchosporium commune]
MNISLSLALSMAGKPKPSSKSTSLPASTKGTLKCKSIASKDFSLYKGISDRPLGWKPKRPERKSARLSTWNIELAETVVKMSMRKWEGAARRSVDWDGLRRDPELWYHDGNCHVHLYEQGQSRRGPAFKVSIDALLKANCRPLLDRFLAICPGGSPSSQWSSDGGYFSQTKDKLYELYIPAPPNVDRGEAFLYHTATRNFFAWLFGKSLIGVHLGGALVGLLNSMNEFRSKEEDNVQGIMDFMDEEGYADMRKAPDHALAILYFAEHFHFKDLWIDAFAHCTGMNERLIVSPGFEYITRSTRALVTRSRLEMDTRLDQCGEQLRSFLSDDLSESHLGLSSAARLHLDKFRSFLQSYYVAKLGYYPPACGKGGAAFPKSIYAQMCSDFHKLYEYLVDKTRTAGDSLHLSQAGGVCVLQNLRAFDQRHKYQPLEYPFPQLPETEDTSRPARRLSLIFKADKMKPDPRLVTLSNLVKATNGLDQTLLESTLVRAYRGFEKDCVFFPTKDRSEKLSQTDARKVRWILVYTILQTLLSAILAPDEVRDTHNVPYNICVLTAGCPPWKEQPYETQLLTQSDQMKLDFENATSESLSDTQVTSTSEIRPDIDYFAITRARVDSEASISSASSKKGTVRKALSTLGNMPELRHPKPQRASYHEILVHGYGNGINDVCIIARPAIASPEDSKRKNSDSSGRSSMEELSSRWSNTSYGAVDSPATSPSNSRRGSDASIETSKRSIKIFLDRPTSAFGLAGVPSNICLESSHEGNEILQPDPLQIKKNENDIMKVTTEVRLNGRRVNLARLMMS